MALPIMITRGNVAWVDEADFQRVNAFRWQACPVDGGGWYAQRTYRGADGRPHVMRMHRFVMSAAPGEEVDHRDHDGLNNRRANLRLCSRTQNQINVRTKGGAGGFRGVEFQPSRGNFRAAVTLAKRKHYCGTFATAEEAARAYDLKAKDLHGAFAVLNFPAERAA